MKEKIRITIMILGLLVLLGLGASIINDILFFIYGNTFLQNYNKPTFMIIRILLLFSLTIIMLKLPPFNEIEESISKFLEKLAKKFKK